ncbi:hypothetical protein HYV50_03650 [Candidatus Pacearchaeota archaeon]|nr:hypothetical protein [Candidatus Pacearchaeota archaeon]
MRYLPQEIEAWYIIPAIRREISKCLIRDYNVTYEKIGSILGITKAAISQYTKGNRAAKIKLPKELNPKIMVSCNLLAKEKSDAEHEINKLLNFLKEKHLPCCIKGRVKEGILEDCREIKFKEGNYR